jgi:threonine synthase
LHKGLQDLVALGWIAKMPRLIGVQAAGSSPLATTWEKHCQGVQLSTQDVTQIAVDMDPVDAQTLADSISAGLPRDRIKALRAVVETGGAYLRVTDKQILAAIPALAQGCGVFAEPAAAASYAGLVQAVKDKLVTPDDRIVVLSTGSGLKDARAAIQATKAPPVIAPELAAVERALEMWADDGRRTISPDASVSSAVRRRSSAKGK